MSTAPDDEAIADEPLAEARAAAALFAAAVRDTQTFAARLDGDPDPDNVAEYAALVAREQAAHARRREAFVALGFTIDSVES